MRRLRQIAGSLILDCPSFAWHLARQDWTAVHNRAEHLTPAPDGAGWRCEWLFTSDLHVAKVFPVAGSMLMRQAFSDWPVTMTNDPPPRADPPKVSFLIGHRGLARLPHLLATLRSIAGQRDVAVECIVVEQSVRREIEGLIPSWVTYVHTPVTDPNEGYNRAWAFNVAARAASGEFLVLHDNDMLVPERYAREIVARIGSAWDFADLKRFTFYLDEGTTDQVFATSVPPKFVPSTIVQNLQGASIVARKSAFLEIGGFDETFVGWGGEDNDFWERAGVAHRVWGFGYLPFIHLYHAPQPGKLMGRDAPAVARYWQLKEIDPSARIQALLARRQGDPAQPWVAPPPSG